MVAVDFRAKWEKNEGKQKFSTVKHQFCLYCGKKHALYFKGTYCSHIICLSGYIIQALILIVF